MAFSVIDFWIDLQLCKPRWITALKLKNIKFMRNLLNIETKLTEKRHGFGGEIKLFGEKEWN